MRRHTLTTLLRPMTRYSSFFLAYGPQHSSLHRLHLHRTICWHWDWESVCHRVRGGMGCQDCKMWWFRMGRCEDMTCICRQFTWCPFLWSRHASLPRGISCALPRPGGPWMYLIRASKLSMAFKLEFVGKNDWFLSATKSELVSGCGWQKRWL